MAFSSSKTVMVAVDDTRAAEMAFSRALRCVSADDHLLIMTVQRDVDNAAVSIAGFAPNSDFLLQSSKAAHDAAKALLNKFGTVAKNHNVNFTLLLGHGAPKDAIVSEANSRNVDLLVIGRRDMGALRRTFVGSTSLYCVENCTGNVLVVHEHESK